MEPPSFAPTHRVPVWLSSHDVQEALTDMVLSYSDALGELQAKALAWDITQMMTMLEATKGHQPS